MAALTNILDWIDQAIGFPQLSFVRPVFATVILMLVVSLAFEFVFSLFGRFFK